MNTPTFGIRESGQVYRCNGHEWTLLGHIADLIHQATTPGREVQAWWRGLLDNDQPCPTLIILPMNKASRIPVEEATIVSDAQPERPPKLTVASDEEEYCDALV